MPGDTKEVSLPECDIVLRADEVLEYRSRTTGEVDLALAQKVVRAAAAFVTAPVPTLIHIDQVAGVTRDARVFFAESAANQAVSSRVALISNSPLARIIANFFMGLNKRQLPTRMFGEPQKALEWLLQS